jgi:uncharacterized protein YjbI with pentapeptide repeats
MVSKGETIFAIKSLEPADIGGWQGCVSYRILFGLSLCLIFGMTFGLGLLSDEARLLGILFISLWFGLGIVFGVIAFFVAFLGYLNQHMNLWSSVRWLTNIFGDFYANVSSELISIVITVLVLDRLNARLAVQERNLSLFRQAKSRSLNVALEAVDQILHDDLWNALLEYYRDHQGQVDLSKVKWAGGVQLSNLNLQKVNLYGSQLENANLESAYMGNIHLENANLGFTHLEDANLENADLENANLSRSKLENADLFAACLENANLWQSQLRNACLAAAHLENAYLGFAQMEQTDLQEAHLENASLWCASLRDAKNIETAIFNEKTALPDAEYLGRAEDDRHIYDKYWTLDTDMTRYTNPKHPNFWEPVYLKPDYIGDKPWWVNQKKDGKAG